MQPHEQLTSREQQSGSAPNVFVLGVGHSGTTILTRMLFALGWHAGGEGLTADDEFAEHEGIRACNRFAMEHGHLPPEATQMLEQIPVPWAVKDPRMVITLQLWADNIQAAGDPLPCLLWIARDLEAVRESHVRRGEFVRGGVGSHGHTIEQLHDLAAGQFDSWRGPKLRLEYKALTNAVKLFNPERGTGNVQNPEYRNQLIALLTSARQEVRDLRDVMLMQNGNVRSLQEKLDRYAADAQDKNAMITALKRMNVDLQKQVRSQAAHTPQPTAAATLRALQTEVERLRNARALARCAQSHVPDGAVVLVISEGDDELVDFVGTPGWHFPRTAEGWHSGSHPATSREAIVELEKCRTQGASFLLVPRVALWWLEHYHAFNEYINGNYCETVRTEDCILFDLRRSAGTS